MSALVSYPVRSPVWVLTYSGANITADVSSMVLSINYVDRLGSASGELEVIIEDRSKLWQGSWYPGLCDQISAQIGYRNEDLLPCGDFQIDDLELTGPPDVMSLRCLAAWITPAMRTRNTVGYEQQTVLGIAQTIASKYGLALFAAPELESVVFARITQRLETDLEFLRRLANEHDYDFTVRGNAMVFYARAALDAIPPVGTISRGDVIDFRFRNRTRRIFGGSQATYFDPWSKQLVGATASASAPDSDVLKLVTRCEDGSQASLKANAALHLNNMLFTTVSLTLPGTTTIAAGNNILLNGWGALDGVYLIDAARHRISRAQGYITELAARRIT